MSDKNISSKEYHQFVSEVVDLVQHHRVLAVQSVQTLSNQLYWNIGELIIKKQKEYGWGKSIVEQLSKDLTHQIGEGVSWSPRNLWFMRQLVNEYSILKQPVLDLSNPNMNQLGSEIKEMKQAASDLDLEKVKQAASELEKVKQLVSEVPWWHNILIIQKVKDIKARIFYLY